ncbi:sucrose phosphorylase [Luteococcus sp. Sow4_B9]|uniref:sucrose phosphorylase n=1 Tax=Luteococcus sp. Sow4_B9 TaxID=3438792 RepID=UPI003F95837E
MSTDAFSLPTISDTSTIPTGDMPGDKVQIDDGHVAKAEVIMEDLWPRLSDLLDGSPHRRAVISVHGGSGVGKSETASVLAAFLRHNGLGAYVMSGDNYPRRIPRDNDVERLRTFRSEGLKALVASGQYDDDVKATLAGLQSSDRDADPALRVEHPWLSAYQTGGAEALERYLGSTLEIDFDEVSAILADFHEGAERLRLKRMGRELDELWYDDVDMTAVQVLVIEWTHGNSANLTGVDLAILLNSTPEETLAHRRSRARDGATDSPFTTMVLGIEQTHLHEQAHRAAIIVNKAGQVISHAEYLGQMGADLPEPGAMINFYPDSMGGTLGDEVDFLNDPAVRGAFTSAYVLPSVFNTDLDRGFSVIDYNLSEVYTRPGDLDALRAADVKLKFDFILNHASVLSPQFQDLLAKGTRSEYADFFIDWNQFWAGHGEMTPEGYIQPDPELIKDMFFRKPGLPILMVRMPDGTEKPYWNTFYQEVRYTAPDAQTIMQVAGVQYQAAVRLEQAIRAALGEGLSPSEMAVELGFGVDVAQWNAVAEHMEAGRRYLGQMDLNIKSEKVWEFYADVLDKLAGYGAEIVRLDAFAYAPKEPGEKNFLNDPGTWELLEQVNQLATARGLKLLPEIHSRYEEGIHELISSKGYLTYDFFLPGLVIDALENRDASHLKRWIDDLLTKQIRTVNMLGCHDGIPLLDLKGLLSDEQIDGLIETVKGRGGYVKDLHGEKKMYYQVNATYYSALGENDEAMLLARAIQLFMPGKPQVWYLDLFGGTNDHAAVERAGAGGHKEINRTNLSVEQVRQGLATSLVQRQLELLRFRNSCAAFGWDAECTVAETAAHELQITWRRDGHEAQLLADLATRAFTITADGEPV